MADGLYAIQSFSTQSGRGRGGYGPAIYLDSRAVRAIADIDSDMYGTQKTIEQLEDQLRLSVDSSDVGYVRVEFEQDSWLLIRLHIGRNCSCFTLAESQKALVRRGRDVTLRYSSHNIDSSKQASAIVSVWLAWFNYAISLTSLKQPFTL